MCGEKPHGSSGFFRRWDHPRVCGEKSRCGTFALQIPGSPPRVRGKAFRDRQVNGFDGITPAYAGKRLLHTSGDIRGWDHPRVCGEKMVSMIPHRRSRGSPPRVRGKGRCHHPVIFVDRITPAYAGKRASASPAPSVPWDHPRVCGEKVSSTSPIKCLKGSPPRMRGKVPQPGVEGCRLGITPAYAGKVWYCLCNLHISGITPACAGKSCST